VAVTVVVINLMRRSIFDLFTASPASNQLSLCSGSE